MAYQDITTGANFTYPFRFENPVKSSTVSGGQNEEFTPFVNTRGCFEKKSGSSGFDQGLQKMVNAYDAYCYWRSDLEAFINKDTRLIYDNRTFMIDSYERMGERRQYFHFDVVEVH